MRSVEGYWTDDCFVGMILSTIYRIYNIGVEVRQGQGRYKDTQVVLLTPRYLLSNQTTFEVLVAPHPVNV